MAGENRPLILLIHGAWHQPAHYASFVSVLEQRGFPVKCPMLPTSKSMEANFEDDVRHVRELAIECLEAGHEVVGLMHSYGGQVGTRAFSGLGSKNRSAEISTPTAVQKLIYLTAFFPPQKGLLEEPLESAPNPPSVSVDDNGGIRLEPVDSFFYNGMSPGEQEAAIKLLVHHTMNVRAAGFQELGDIKAAWWDIPTIQIVCDDDQALSKGYQERMGDKVRSELNGVAEVPVEHCQSGHSPYLSMPEKLADMVERICIGD